MCLSPVRRPEFFGVTMENPCNITVSLGFDAVGYEAAVKEYLMGLVGKEYTQELYDEALEHVTSLIQPFVKVAEFTLVPK
jgi:hypothetical protein